MLLNLLESDVDTGSCQEPQEMICNWTASFSFHWKVEDKTFQGKNDIKII